MIETLSKLPPVLVDLWRLSLWFALLAVIFIPIEHFAGIRKLPIRRAQWGNDVIYFFLSGLIPKLLLAPPMALAALALNTILPHAWLNWSATLPTPARYAGAMLCGELGFYAAHRAMHEIPLLWRFHALHHSAENIDWLVNTRLHPADLVFTRLAGFVLIYGFGFAPTEGAASQMPLAIILFGTIWGFVIHLNVKIRLGPIEWLIATPAFHHWHHSKVDHRDHNYAAVFPWVDRIFGTLYLPQTWPAEYGVIAEFAPDFASQIIEPFEP
jgi:sterol desaturase/sphingolipid hydroxylase (fatty acid hydroxylase superfamily)